MGILNDVMVSADCEEFVEYMKPIYFATKHNSLDDEYMKYLDTSDTKYRTLYRRGSRSKLVILRKRALLVTQMDSTDAIIVSEDEGGDEVVEMVNKGVEVEMDRQGNDIKTVARWVVS